MADKVTLNSFAHEDIGPPFAFAHRKRAKEDPAAYILRPDVEFRRPWLATPEGTAFVWPMGVEGFDVNSDVTLGVHQYIGDPDVDAIVVFPDQTQIVLNGSFPGLTGIDAMQELKRVIREPTPKQGKYLALPGILEDIARVHVQNARFTHESGDTTHSVGYSISFIRVGLDRKLVLPALAPGGNQGTSSPTPDRVGLSSVSTGSASSTIRSLSAFQAATNTSLYSVIKGNADVFADAGIPLFQSPFKSLPAGKALRI